MTAPRLEMPPADASRWIAHGAVGGVLAGLVFAAFQVLAASVTGGPAHWLTPLRMIGAILMGGAVLDPGSPAVAPAAVGMLLHLALSALFGAAFGWVVRAWLTQPAAHLVVTASGYGVLLWLVNFHMIAPIAGWNWFPARSSPVVQLVAHVVFYGALLGLYLDRARGDGGGTREPLVQWLNRASLSYRKTGPCAGHAR
jgi:hypothetical protein